jgi:uncharacterized protein YjiS (DUF1127 family)
MTTTYSTTEVAETTASASHPSRLLRRCWDAVRERRERARTRAALYGMSDRELRDIGIVKDIGIPRGEIEYMVSGEPLPDTWVRRR